MITYKQLLKILFDSTRVSKKYKRAYQRNSKHFSLLNALKMYLKDQGTVDNDIENVMSLEALVYHLDELSHKVFQKFAKKHELAEPEYGFLSDDCFSPGGLAELGGCLEYSIDVLFGFVKKLLEHNKKEGLVLLFKFLNVLATNGLTLSWPADKLRIDTNPKSIIKHLKIIALDELEEFHTEQKIKFEPTSIQQRYFPVSSYPNQCYTYYKDRFIQLPQHTSSHELVYTLITKLLYEHNHHEWNQEPCTTIRGVLYRLFPFFKNMSIKELHSYMNTVESETGDYYEEYPSEDSDSDEEIDFNEHSKIIQAQSKKSAQSILTTMLPQPKTYKKHFKEFTHPSASSPSKKRNPAIPRDKQFELKKVKASLKKINKHVKGGGKLTETFLDGLPHDFVVAQYRGIHYVTSAWDKGARKSHRELDEINQPQFSSSVFVAAGITSYREYIERLESDPSFQKKISKKALLVQEKLQALNDSKPVSYDGYAYQTPLQLLQHWYSSDYDGYTDKVKRRLDNQDEIFYTYLLNEHRPFLSTADTPMHALLYAYGIKLYEGHKHERLRPRWNSKGRALRPYSGKVYLSLHPISDYQNFNPSHVTSLFNQGVLPLSNLISAERETSFLGYLPKNRVAYHYKAKYLSFHHHYKSIYLYKYGIDKDMFLVLKKAMLNSKPHTEKRKAVKHVLGEYLCKYHEMRLVRHANELAKQENKILLYRDQNGLYSLSLPDTPSTAISSQKVAIMARRSLLRKIGELNLSRVVKRIDFKRAEQKTKEHYKSLNKDKSSVINYLDKNYRTAVSKFFTSRAIASSSKTSLKSSKVSNMNIR